jgi:MFS family permease
LTSALFSTTGPAILADIVPRQDRGKAYGASLGVLYMGLTLGPIVSGYLVEWSGWRAVFWASAAVMGCAIVLIQFSLPTKWRSPSEKIDLTSGVLVSVGILLAVAGSSVLDQTLPRIAAITAGAATLGLFLVRQFSLDRPLVDLRAVNSNDVLRNALSVQSLLYLNVVTTTFLLSVYLQVSLDQSADTAGSIIAIGTVVMALGAPISGRFVDRLAPTLLTRAGVCLVLLSTIAATQLSLQTPTWRVAVVVMLQGAGFALFSSTNMTTIMNSVGAETVSMASALGATARRIGMLSGMMLVGFLISLSFGHTPVASDPARFVDVMQLSFAILAGFTAAALLVSFVGKRSID